MTKSFWVSQPTMNLDIELHTVERWVRGWLDQITFRDGVVFEVSASVGILMLTMSAQVPDVTRGRASEGVRLAVTEFEEAALPSAGMWHEPEDKYPGGINRPLVTISGSTRLPWEVMFDDKPRAWVIFMECVWQLIVVSDGHERMEWLRVNGKPIYDPHPRRPDGTVGSSSQPRFNEPRLPDR